MTKRHRLRLFFMLLITVSCSFWQTYIPEPTSSKPSSTKKTVSSSITSVSPEVPREILTTTPEEIHVDDYFDPSTANQIAPRNILKEISFYAQGGGVICDKPPQATPKIEYQPVDSELMTLNIFVVCWLPENQTFTGTIQYPDGRITSQTVQTTDDYNNTYFANLNFKALANDPEGLYIFILENENYKFDAKANFYKPDGPRLFYGDKKHIVFYGFAPRESVKLFHYNDHNQFTSWQEYTMNSDGQLTIEFSPAQHDLELFVAIGSQSGEVRLFHDDFHGGRRDWVREQSIIIKQAKQQTCNGLQSRLSLGERVRVAFTDGTEIRIRTKAGFTQKVNDTAPEGTLITLINGPKCADDSTWWKVRTDNNQIGWMAEDQKGVYLLEPIP